MACRAARCSTDRPRRTRRCAPPPARHPYKAAAGWRSRHRVRDRCPRREPVAQLVIMRRKRVHHHEGEGRFAACLARLDRALQRPAGGDGIIRDDLGSAAFIASQTCRATVIALPPEASTHRREQRHIIGREPKGRPRSARVPANAPHRNARWPTIAHIGPTGLAHQLDFEALPARETGPRGNHRHGPRRAAA